MSSLQTEVLLPAPDLRITEIIEADLGCQPLEPADSTWLSTLSLESAATHREHLAHLNELVVIGSTNLSGRTSDHEMRATTEARREFFGQILGWDKSDHTLHASYRRIQEDRNRLTPLDTFIETQRILYKYEIDPVNLLKTRPEMISYAAPTVEKKILTLQELGLDATQLINTFPALLAYNPEVLAKQYGQFIEFGVDPRLVPLFPTLLALKPERIKRRIHTLSRASEVLGWQGDVDTLIQIFPQILGVSDEKLRTHARLLATYGSSDMAEEEVKSHISEPLESHIISLTDEPTYSRLSVSGIRRTLPATERKALAQEILSNQPMAETKLGKKAVKAYSAYARKNKSPKRSFAKTGSRQ